MIRTIKKILGHRNPIRLGWHFFKAFVAAFRYRFPARKLTVIGITGTDGKTTTVGMTAHILHEAGIPVGALSTAFFRIKDSTEWNKTEKTSPSPFVIQKFLRKLVDNGCTHAVLEYSSHGLVQGRTNYTWAKVGAITNTAMELLDYHGTMERYRKDKGKLFHLVGKRGTKVLNADDESFDMYDRIRTKDTILYSKKSLEQGLWISQPETTINKTTAKLHDSETSSAYDLNLNIPGSFNLENAMCAIACARSVGVPIEKAVDSLKTYKSVSSRMEAIDEGQNFSVFIDFAISPQAFEKILTTTREIVGDDKRILVLTGSCGDRMREKRPIIGKLCSELADVVVITDDEPYTEDPLQVIEDVWNGVDQSQCSAHKIIDRREAMEFILKDAKEGDSVLLCGLGSYPSRMFADGPHPWDEQGTTREILKTI